VDRPDAFEIGAVVLGRYRIVRRLGAGNMAVVYLAIDGSCENREVAVKVPNEATYREAAVRERFLRETRRLSELEHAHIVPLLDAGIVDARPIQVMAVMTHGSLADRLQRLGTGTGTRRVLPPDDLRRWLADVASALDYMHARGVVHRDVKPGNILFDAGEQARVTDFGIAKALHGESSLTPSGQLVGTATYVPPEAVVPTETDGEIAPPGPAFDQYALATVVFELLAGFPPYPGGSAVGVLYLKARQSAPTLARAAKQPLSDALVEAVDRGLSRAPADRWSSCAAFAHAALQ
jgi:serine/threonine-protein kinase